MQTLYVFCNSRHSTEHAQKYVTVAGILKTVTIVTVTLCPCNCGTGLSLTEESARLIIKKRKANFYGNFITRGKFHKFPSP